MGHTLHVYNTTPPPAPYSGYLTHRRRRWRRRHLEEAIYKRRGSGSRDGGDSNTSTHCNVGCGYTNRCCCGRAHGRDSRAASDNGGYNAFGCWRDEPANGGRSEECARAGG